MKLVSVLALLAMVAVPMLNVGVAGAQGQSTIVVANNFHVPMTFQVDRSSFTIAPGNGQVISLPAGNHTYMGAVAGWEGVNGTISLPAGQTFSLLARPGRLDSIFGADGKPLDTRSDVQLGLTWMEWWQGPAGNRLPVQNPGSGAAALVFENYLGSDLHVDSGADFNYSVLGSGRLEIIKEGTPVRYTVSSALTGDKAQKDVNGVINLAPGQISVLAFNDTSGDHLSATVVPSANFQ